MMKKGKNKKGFTLAELLVVVAIIGILVAVSVPMFAAQKEKAVRAVNQANIRAAKAAAMTELYAGTKKDYTTYLEFADTGTGLEKYIYFVYDVKEARIVDAIIPDKNKKIDWDTVNAEAEGQLEKAANNQVCDKIYVFENINKNGNKQENVIQTCPYYDKNGKVGTKDKNNPFGPRT